MYQYLHVKYSRGRDKFNPVHDIDGSTRPRESRSEPKHGRGKSRP
jgi:hypothetical protein